MSYTAKSYSSFDTNDYIDLDTALVQEELRSLGATPETIDYNNDSYRISFKNMDARETARLRDSLVTPMSSYSINVRSMLKTPVDSCAESVALFKNLANNDHIDLVSSDLKDFMDNCDLDDLMSRPSSRPNASASPLQPYRHSKDGLTSSRLSNHNRAEQKKHQETAPASTLLQKLSEPHQQHGHYYSQNEEDEPSAPLRHTNHDGYSNPVIHTHKPTRNNINDSANTNKYEPPMSVLENPKSRAMQSILSKRRSIDSDGLRRLQQTNVEPTPSDSRLLSKRHSMMSISEHEPTPTRSKLPTTAQRRNSNLQQPAVSTATLKRRNSNMQQSAAATAPLQRRNSNLQQSALSKTNIQRRNSNTAHPPVEPEVALERRNSKTQQQAQPDRRRWSSYIPDHNVVVENQLPQKDMAAPQRTSRQEPRRLLNRHSMLLPSSARRYSREEEEVYEAPAISQRQLSREQDVNDSKTSPQIHAQSTAEKVRRRHTLSASDKRASMGQLPRHTVDKRASLHLATSRVHATFGDDEEDDQINNVPQVQQERLIHSDKRPHQIKTSSYERSVEEPNRYRSKLRNPMMSRDYETQLSSSLRTTVLSNSKHVSPREYQHHTTRLSKRSELQLQSSHDEAARYQHESSDLVHSQAYEYEQADEDLITPPSRYASRDLGEQRHNQLPTATTAAQQRRNRALSAPSNHHQATEKPSLMPVPVRYRKHSNNSISKYTSVPENAGLTSFSPPREARLYPEEIIQVEASRSSGGLSNSTASSSHSSDRYYDPPTPPTSAVNTTYGSHGKRRSVPVMNASIIDEQVRKTENRYSSYLARVKKDAMMAEHQDINPSRRLVPRRQRVLSEDNENYRHQIEQRRKSQQQQAYRDEDTEDVISSAKHLLSMVKERRNRAH
ncbi:hypothetical protein V8B55DRAFT_1391583 [Mucor lusitanicus]|uniref:Uncharacterized protein n=1 Tax=Mucor circinelloides f. lusitanicus TaxID=29924 RepID=A0A8H4BDS1_MUCCL|nr:hypothetical protein FB192DRAFT_1380634 [Mucor lusitanicus]